MLCTLTWNLLAWGHVMWQTYSVLLRRERPLNFKSFRILLLLDWYPAASTLLLAVVTVVTLLHSVGQWVPVVAASAAVVSLKAFFSSEICSTEVQINPYVKSCLLKSQIRRLTLYATENELFHLYVKVSLQFTKIQTLTSNTIRNWSTSDWTHLHPDVSENK
jgi:hypothetical protein